MSDALWFILPVCVVMAIAGMAWVHEAASGCIHKWGKWQWSEDAHAYRQHRVCAKCGFTEMTQRKKLMAGGDE